MDAIVQAGAGAVDWYSDGNNIYDVVCCTAVGSAYSLYSCTDAYNCDDSGAGVVCTLNGAPRP